jgi:hypothetical protein
MNKFLKALHDAKMKKVGVKVINKSIETKDADLSLTELREKYPNIKANSKAKFLQKLEA